MWAVDKILVSATHSHCFSSIIWTSITSIITLMVKSHELYIFITFLVSMGLVSENHLFSMILYMACT